MIIADALQTTMGLGTRIEDILARHDMHFIGDILIREGGDDHKLPSIYGMGMCSIMKIKEVFEAEKADNFSTLSWDMRFLDDTKATYRSARKARLGAT